MFQSGLTTRVSGLEFDTAHQIVMAVLGSGTGGQPRPAQISNETGTVPGKHSSSPLAISQFLRTLEQSRNRSFRCSCP